MSRGPGWVVQEFSLRPAAGNLMWAFFELWRGDEETITYSSRSYKSPMSAINAAKRQAVLFGVQLDKPTLVDIDPWISDKIENSLDKKIRAVTSSSPVP